MTPRIHGRSHGVGGGAVAGAAGRGGDGGGEGGAGARVEVPAGAQVVPAPLVPSFRPPTWWGHSEASAGPPPRASTCPLGGHSIEDTWPWAP